CLQRWMLLRNALPLIQTLSSRTSRHSIIILTKRSFLKTMTYTDTRLTCCVSTALRYGDSTITCIVIVRMVYIWVYCSGWGGNSIMLNRLLWLRYPRCDWRILSVGQRNVWVFTL